jgi:hypothetical protein
VKYPNSKWTLPPLATAVLAVLMMLASALGTGRLSEAQPSSPPAGDLASFSVLAPIDAHVHLYKDDPAFSALMQRLNLRILDICVIDDRDPYFKGLEPQRGDALKVVHSTGGRAVLCTTFSPYEFEEPGFAQRTIRQLDADFAKGAIAVKIYKVMGMEMKSKAGKRSSLLGCGLDDRDRSRRQRRASRGTLVQFAETSREQERASYPHGTLHPNASIHQSGQTRRNSQP